MLSAQWYKVLYDLWNNKTRSLLIILSIAVGLTAMGATMSASAMLSNSLTDSFVAINYSSGSINAIEPIDKEFVSSVRNSPGIKEADARRTLNIRVQDVHQKWHILQIFAVTNFEDIHVNIVTPSSGAWPPPRRQILVDDSTLSVLGVQVGDDVWIEMPGSKLRQVHIAGTVSDLAVPPAMMSNTTYAYGDTDTLEWLGAPTGYNSLTFITDDQSANSNVENTLKEIKDKAEKAGYVVPKYQVTEETPISKPMQTILLIMQAAGVLTIILSIFLIYNTISAMVTQQIKQIGTMKAIGARTSQILRMYFTLVVIYGVSALCIAVPTAAFGAQFLSQFFSGLFGFSIHYSPAQPKTILIQAAVAILVPTLASLYPLIDGLHISVVDALSGLRSSHKTSPKKGLIDRLLSGKNFWMTRFWLMRPVVLAIRNLFRQKVRLGLTLMALILAGAVFMTVLNLRTTIFNYMNRFNQMKQYDIQVEFTQPYHLEDVKQTTTNVPGVGEIDTWLQTLTQRAQPDGSDSKQFPLVALHANSKLMTSPYMLKGRWLITDDENALVITSPMLTSEPDLQVGQEITLKLADRNRTFEIIGVALSGSGETVYASLNYIAPLIHSRNDTNTLLVKIDPAAGIDEPHLAADLEAYYTQNKYAVSAIKTMGEERASSEENFGAPLSLLVMLAIMLAIVGGLGLMGTMTINVIERTREIGVLRSIGASNGGVIQVFMIEGLAIGLISCCFAIPLSIPITAIIANAIGNIMSNAPWEGSFNPSGVLLWVVIVIILSLLANYLPTRNASRLTVREVLAYE